MSDFPTPTQITDLASLLAPGLIISAILNRATTGSLPDFKDRLIAYGLFSTGYFAAITPLFHVETGPHLSIWLWNLLQFFIVPVCLGVMAAYAYQAKALYRLAALARLHLAHHLPASWDYAFENLSDATYLLVTLQDGTQIAGRWARGSFAASSKDERDLLLSEMWQIGETGKSWMPQDPPRSILVCGQNIRHVEFFGA